MTSVAELKNRVIAAEKQVKLLQSKLDAFFTGDVPEGADLEHMVLAKYGRVRLAEKAKVPKLLSGNKQD